MTAKLAADHYLNSLGIELTRARPTIGRLALGGEFRLADTRGVLIRPKRGDVSDRYLELLADEGYELVVVDTGGYPSFYARHGEGLAPIRALPVSASTHFPTTEILDAWAQLIRASAGAGEAGRLGAAQILARLDGHSLSGTDLVQPVGRKPMMPLGGEATVDAESLRTAAALVAGYRLRPESPDELARLTSAIVALQQGKGEPPGLVPAVGRLTVLRHLGARRLVASSAAGAEIAALSDAAGTAVLPDRLRVLEPLLERLLPDVEHRFGDFLQSALKPAYDGVVVVPPIGQQIMGSRLRGFELSRRRGKTRALVPAEMPYVEHGLAATADGGLLLAVLPEGLLSSAGYADFRAWLLSKARLLAVLSLPAGACFGGTSVKCSVVLMTKPARPDDYPILMVDVEDGDLEGDLDAARAKIIEHLDRELAPCD